MKIFNDHERARAIERTYKVAEGIYLIGTLETGVTVYKQQVRAHNLTWALWELSNRESPPRKIAIIGGGITGLTATACILSLFPTSRVTIFEKRWSFCPLQLGCDTRWLHPKIYDWPEYGSRAPTAQLPVLNWSEGRASDVVRNIIQGFSSYCLPNKERLTIYIGLTHFRIAAQQRSIQWMGRKVSTDGTFSPNALAEGAADNFDLIILAPGYGLEASRPHYWQNDQLSQPILNGERRPYLISGYGDGALVDLCRLTISGFRQDTILKDLFGRTLESVESDLLEKRNRTLADAQQSNFDFFSTEAASITETAKQQLGRKIRQDTAVTMHLAGRKELNRSLQHVLDSKSSFLNKLLLFLLYGSGAFTTSFSPLEQTQREQRFSEIEYNLSSRTTIGRAHSPALR